MCVGTGTGSTDLSVPRMIQSMTLRSPPDAKDGLIFETQMGGGLTHMTFSGQTLIQVIKEQGC